MPEFHCHCKCSKCPPPASSSNTSLQSFNMMLGPPLFLSVTRARLHFINREQSTAVTNDFWRNAFLYDYTTYVCESVGAWPRRRRTWQAVPRQPSDHHRPPPDFRLPTRGKRVQRQPPDYRLPSVVVFRLPYSILRLPPRITDQLQDSRVLCFCLLLRFYALVPFPRQ